MSNSAFPFCLKARLVAHWTQQRTQATRRSAMFVTNSLPDHFVLKISFSI